MNTLKNADGAKHSTPADTSNGTKSEVEKCFDEAGIDAETWNKEACEEGREMKRVRANETNGTLETVGTVEAVSYPKFLIEKNAKNKAYYFILSNGLFDRFAEFCENYNSSDSHADCVKFIIDKSL